MKKLNNNQLESVSGGEVIYVDDCQGFCCGTCDDCGLPIHTKWSVYGLPEIYVPVRDFHSVEIFGKTFNFCNACYRNNRYDSRWNRWLRCLKSNIQQMKLILVKVGLI